MKTHLIKLLSVILLPATSLYAQNINYEWGANTGSVELDRTMALCLDNSGNVIEVGNYRGTVDMDPGAGVQNFTSLGYYDTYIKKIDPFGNLIWVRSVGGNFDDVARAVHVDDADNIYITGNFVGTADFDPGAGTVSYSSFGPIPKVDIFILKLDPNGDYLWSHHIGGADHDRGFALGSDDLNNIYIGGYFTDSVDFDPGPADASAFSTGVEDMYLLKLDENGGFIWNKTFGGTDTETILSLVVDGNSDIVITGSFAGTVDFDPNAGVENHASNGLEDMFVSKLDSAGNTIWTITEGGIDEDGSKHVTVNDADEIYMAGTFMDVVDFDPTTGIDLRSSNGKEDAVIQKISSVGQIEWTRTFGGDSTDVSRRISIDQSQSLFVVGNFEEQVDFDPGTGIDTVTSAGLADIFITKFNGNGDHMWVESFGDSASQAGISISNDDFGNLYITGTYLGSTDFDPSAGTAILTSAGLTDACLIQYSYCAETTSTVVVSACNSYTSPSENYTWTTSGNYVDTLYGSNACGGDSIINFQLTIDNVDNTVTQINEVTLQANDPSATYQWIDCDNGPVAGATDQSFTATQNGNYAVAVTNGSCTDTSACIPITSVGIDDLGSTIGFSIWPNPTSGEIQVSIPASIVDASIGVYDVSGRRIQSIKEINGDAVNIDIQSPTGIYYVVLFSQENRIASRKLVRL